MNKLQYLLGAGFLLTSSLLMADSTRGSVIIKQQFIGDKSAISDSSRMLLYSADQRTGRVGYLKTTKKRALKIGTVVEGSRAKAIGKQFNNVLLKGTVIKEYAGGVILFLKNGRTVRVHKDPGDSIPVGYSVTLRLRLKESGGLFKSKSSVDYADPDFTVDGGEIVDVTPNGDNTDVVVNVGDETDSDFDPSAGDTDADTTITISIPNSDVNSTISVGDSIDFKGTIGSDGKVAVDDVVTEDNGNTAGDGSNNNGGTNSGDSSNTGGNSGDSTGGGSTTTGGGTDSNSGSTGGGGDSTSGGGTTVDGGTGSGGGTDSGSGGGTSGGGTTNDKDDSKNNKNKNDKNNNSKDKGCNGKGNVKGNGKNCSK